MFSFLSKKFIIFVFHVFQICKLLRHVALSESLQIQAKNIESNLRIYGPQVITSTRALSTHPQSKIAKENVEVFVDMWQWLSSDIASIAKEILDTAQAHVRSDKSEYLSLPRPGVSGLYFINLDKGK